MRLVDGTAASGTWSGLIYIPEQTPPGTYELTVIVNDATDFPKPIGRMTWFRPGSLRAGGFDLSFEQTGATDTDPPSVTAVSLEPDPSAGRSTT